jgi:hypothetical protein
VRPELRRAGGLFLALGAALLPAPPLAAAQQGGRPARGQPQQAQPAKPPPRSKGAAQKQPKKSAKQQPPAGKPAQPEPAPPDPLAEADRVTDQADWASARREELERTLREHFKICDLDGNGWISFREANATLGLDRGEYRRHDADQDGRLAPAEFLTGRKELLARLGAVEPSAPTVPVPARPTEPEGQEPRGAFDALFPKPADLIARYDGNGTGGLDAAEVETLFQELDLPLSADLVGTQMDPNGSGQLEPAELLPLALLVSQHIQETGRAVPRSSPAAPEQAEPGTARSSRPPGTRTRRPLSHFERLDPWNDGWIDEADLRSLLSGSRLSVRLSAVLSALDQDGDGRLGEAEFLDSLRGRER